MEIFALLIWQNRLQANDRTTFCTFSRVSPPFGYITPFTFCLEICQDKSSGSKATETVQTLSEVPYAWCHPSTLRFPISPSRLDENIKIFLRVFFDFFDFFFKLQSKKVFLSLALGPHLERVAELLVDIKRLAEGLPTSCSRWLHSNGTF